MKNQVMNKSNDSFTALCECTLAACNKTVFPPSTFSEGGNRWIELANAWDNLLVNGSEGIFYDAVHRIMWGIPCGDSVPKYNGIVQIVIAELLKDDAAFEAWDSYETCDAAILEITAEMDPWVQGCDDYRNSIEHHLYLENKTLWSIRYSKQKYADERQNQDDFHLAYEKAIKQIVPSATSWPEDFWYNESHIYDELIKLYGVDYRDDYIEYGRILLILIAHDEDPEQDSYNEAWFASTIKRMPMALAEAIWPKDTKMKIVQMFMLAAELTEQLASDGVDLESTKSQCIHPVCTFDFKTLHDSWLYAIMEKWFSNNNHPNKIVRNIRKKLFTIAMNA